MRLADRNGSNAVAKAIMVKSGMRKKTSDRLIGCLTAFKEPSWKTDMRHRCRYQHRLIRNFCGCQWNGGRAENKICKHRAHRRKNAPRASSWECRNFQKKSRASIAGAASNSLFARRDRRGGSAAAETEAGSGDGTGLARHRAVKPLTLQRGGQVHFAVAGEETRQEFHDMAPLDDTGCLRWICQEWGISFDGADIGITCAY